MTHCRNVDYNTPLAGAKSAPQRTEWVSCTEWVAWLYARKTEIVPDASFEEAGTSQTCVLCIPKVVFHSVYRPQGVFIPLAVGQRSCMYYNTHETFPIAHQILTSQFGEHSQPQDEALRNLTLGFILHGQRGAFLTG